MMLPLSPAIEQNGLEGQLIPKINVNGIADDCYALSNPTKDLDKIMTSLLCIRGGEKFFFFFCVYVHVKLSTKVAYWWFHSASMGADLQTLNR